MSVHYNIPSLMSLHPYIFTPIYHRIFFSQSLRPCDFQWETAFKTLPNIADEVRLHDVCDSTKKQLRIYHSDQIYKLGKCQYSLSTLSSYHGSNCVSTSLVDL